MPQALDVPMRATTARTRSFTNAGSMPTPQAESSPTSPIWSGHGNVSEVAFLDSNFPVNVGRAVEIARGFIDSNIRFSSTFRLPRICCAA